MSPDLRMLGRRTTCAGASAICQLSARVLQTRGREDAAQCMLVIISATPEGKKELVGLIDSLREVA